MGAHTGENIYFFIIHRIFFGKPKGNWKCFIKSILMIGILTHKIILAISNAIGQRPSGRDHMKKTRKKITTTKIDDIECQLILWFSIYQIFISGGSCDDFFFHFSTRIGTIYHQFWSITETDIFINKHITAWCCWFKDLLCPFFSNHLDPLNTQRKKKNTFFWHSLFLKLTLYRIVVCTLVLS